MGVTASAIKTLVVPAVVALLVFLALTYAVVPLWQRYRNRYSQYLPLETLSTQTTSLRHRIQNSIGLFFLPSTWRPRLTVVRADDASDVDFNSEDGEELGDVDEDRRRVLDGRGGASDSTGRLSRDLEQGFMDDSDDEEIATPWYQNSASRT